MGKLARAAIAAVPNFIPVAAHLSFIKSICPLIQVTRREIRVGGMVQQQWPVNNKPPGGRIVFGTVVETMTNHTTVKSLMHSGSSVSGMRTSTLSVEGELSERQNIKSLLTTIAISGKHSPN